MPPEEPAPPVDIGSFGPASKDCSANRLVNAIESRQGMGEEVPASQQMLAKRTMVLSRFGVRWHERLGQSMLGSEQEFITVE